MSAHRILVKASLAVFAVGFLRASPGAACTPIVDVRPVCPEALRGLCQTPAGGDVASRRAAIRAALLSGDAPARAAAARFLSEASREIDLRPYADILLESCPSREACFWNAEQDYWARLRFDPLPDRVAAFEQMIRVGRSGYPPGELPRYILVQTAAYQGMSELRPLIEEYLGTLTPIQRERYRVIPVLAVLELAGGAESEADAGAVAAARLAQMDDEALFRRMEGEKDFRDAVLDLSGRACRVSVLTGERPTACVDVARVVHRQKARFPNSSFSSGCMLVQQGDPLPAWLDHLHSVAGEDARPDPDAESEARNGRPEHSTRLDACSVPDLPGAERWDRSPFWGGSYYALVRDENTGKDVGIADGLVGHRPGETVRLHLDIRDRKGNRPTFPVAVRVSVLEGGSGSVGLVGRPERCASLRFFWNRAASNETTLVDTEEFDLNVGRAEAAGLLPDLRSPRATVPLWKSTARILIDIAQLKDSGERAEYMSGGIFDVRPVGDLGSSAPPDPYAALVRLVRSAPGQLEELGPNLEADYESVAVQPLRHHLAIADPNEVADTKRFGCRAIRRDRKGTEPDTEASIPEEVTLRRLGSTSIFVAPFIVMGAGTPMPDTEIGRALNRPIVLLECCGTSDLSCDPTAP